MWPTEREPGKLERDWYMAEEGGAAQGMDEIDPAKEVEMRVILVGQLLTLNETNSLFSIRFRQ